MDHPHPAAGPRTIDQSLDSAPLSLFHLRALLAASAGFLTDAYDLFIIGTAVVLVAAQWHLGATQVGLLSSVTLAATLVGAAVFGRIADKLGRKSVYGIVTVIMVGGALGSALAPSYAWLLGFRALLGLGIGGDYPVSAVLMSEYANRSHRGRLVSLVFSMQALGLIIGPMVALTLLGAGISHALAWRIMLGIGALPALAVLYLRTTLPESPRFVDQVAGDTEAAAASLRSLRLNPGEIRRAATERLRTGAFWKLLAVTAGSWFLLDYAYYGNTISTPLVLRAVAPGASLIQSTAWTLVVFVVFALPGYLLASLTIDRIGHRRLQWLGFAAMAMSFGAIAAVPGIATAIGPFLLLYGLSYFFSEFGPNTTTFVIPTDLFPVAQRATGHGLSAAVGKLGAFIGVFLFPVITSHLGLRGTLGVSTAAAVAGVVLTLALPRRRPVAPTTGDSDDVAAAGRPLRGVSAPVSSPV